MTLPIIGSRRIIRNDKVDTPFTDAFFYFEERFDFQSLHIACFFWTPAQQQQVNIAASLFIVDTATKKK